MRHYQHLTISERESIWENKLAGKSLRDLSLRNIYGINIIAVKKANSSDFEVNIGNGEVTFVTSGSGHRVGLSQYGANGMAKQGKTYREILEHYYSGVEVKKQK